jgi:hypothetical protein
MPLLPKEKGQLHVGAASLSGGLYFRVLLCEGDDFRSLFTAAGQKLASTKRPSRSPLQMRTTTSVGEPFLASATTDDRFKFEQLARLVAFRDTSLCVRAAKPACPDFPCEPIRNILSLSIPQIKGERQFKNVVPLPLHPTSPFAPTMGEFAQKREILAD